MARLESTNVHRALAGKMRTVVSDKPGDRYYIIQDEDGVDVASTSISKGAKHTLGDARVQAMARQLCLNQSKLLVQLVDCSLSREEALAITKANCPPGTSRQRR
jgi:hypothetical protein